MKAVHALLLAVFAVGFTTLLAQDEGAPQICPKLNKCRKKTTKERKKCPSCDRKKIFENDAICSTCARKQKLCKLCGLGKTVRAKGGTVDDAIKTITEKDMRDFLMKFAGDGMEGRNTGSPGIQRARAMLIAKLKKAGAKPLKGGSFEIPWRNCANVGTLYEGSDPKLKNEYVIVGSHMDHIGKGGGDGINNGADDNGSGSTTNAEICEALFLSGIKTKRSIINLWFTGEEKGLLGSKGYCADPAVPHSQCVAMLNCDMLGRNPNKQASLWGVGSSPQFSAVVDKAMSKVPKANVNKVMGKGQYFHRSDQANFWNKGIPVMFISTGMHPDYHKSSDHPEKIAYERMSELGRFMFVILIELANAETRPTKNDNYR